MKRLLKKERKKESKHRKKIVALLKPDDNDNTTSVRTNNKHIIENVIKSVNLNKKLLAKDKYNLKKWQNDYYQSLFSKFKKLIDDYNKGFEFDDNELTNKIQKKQKQLGEIKRELAELKGLVKSLKAEKGILTND